MGYYHLHLNEKNPSFNNNQIVQELTVNNNEFIYLHVLKKNKTQISNLVRTTRFWNNYHQVHSKQKDWTAK